MEVSPSPPVAALVIDEKDVFVPSI